MEPVIAAQPEEAPRARGRSLLHELRRALTRWRRRQQSLQVLRRLDQRTLKDIGLSRGDFNTVAERYANGQCYRRGVR